MSILLVVSLNVIPAKIKFSDLDDEVHFANDDILTGEYIYNLIIGGAHDGAVIISSDSNRLNRIRDHCFSLRSDLSAKYFRYLHFDKENKLSFGDPDPCGLPNINHAVLSIDTFDIVPRLLQTLRKEFDQHTVVSSSDPED